MPDRDSSDFSCSVCSRPLNRVEDPLSEDCGGDCLGCIIVAEDGEVAPVLPDAELRAWIDARWHRMDALWARAARDVDPGDGA